MRKTILLPVCLLLAFSVAAQKIDVTAYSFFGLGMNTSKDKKFGAELKGLFNRSFKETGFELTGLYQFKRKPLYQFSVGVGINMAPFRGFDELNYFVVPVQFALFPIKDVPQLSFIAELTPEISVQERFAFRNLWGVRYAFGKR